RYGIIRRRPVNKTSQIVNGSDLARLLGPFARFRYEFLRLIHLPKPVGGVSDSAKVADGLCGLDVAHMPELLESLLVIAAANERQRQVIVGVLVIGFELDRLAQQPGIIIVQPSVVEIHLRVGAAQLGGARKMTQRFILLALEPAETREAGFDLP